MKHSKISSKLSILALLLINFVVVSCIDKQHPHDDDNPPNTNPPEEIISLEQAKVMYDNYTTRRVPIIQQFEGPNPDGTAFMPTRNGWYDYDTLKQYMAYIEKEAKDAGVEISGMSVYLTNYPNAQTFPDGKPVKYPKQNSFFFVPTLESNGEHFAFLTTGTNEGGRAAVPIKERIQNMPPDTLGRVKNNNNGVKQSAIFSFSFQNNNGGDKSLILNESHLAPPPVKPTDMDNR